MGPGCGMPAQVWRQAAHGAAAAGSAADVHTHPSTPLMPAVGSPCRQAVLQQKKKGAQGESDDY